MADDGEWCARHQWTEGGGWWQWAACLLEDTVGEPEEHAGNEHDVHAEGDAVDVVGPNRLVGLRHERESRAEAGERAYQLDNGRPPLLLLQPAVAAGRLRLELVILRHLVVIQAGGGQRKRSSADAVANLLTTEQAPGLRRHGHALEILFAMTEGVLLGRHGAWFEALLGALQTSLANR